MAVDASQAETNGSCNLFTASRDRLIKVWHVDYAKMQSSVQGASGSPNPSVTRGISLLADLDDHTDWVNQIKIIPEVKTLISCSNDTTIRIWRYKSNHSYEGRNERLAQGNANKVYRQSAFSTFQDHDDYVRCIDYASSHGRLFSASDDGKIFLWDLHAEKLMQKYANFDEAGNFDGK